MPNPAFKLTEAKDGAKTLGFTSDGRRMVTGCAGSDAFKIWDFRSRSLLTLEADGLFWTPTLFSRDDNLFGSLDATGLLHIWRAPTWEEVAEIEAKERPSME